MKVDTATEGCELERLSAQPPPAMKAHIPLSPQLLATKHVMEVMDCTVTGLNEMLLPVTVMFLAVHSHADQ